MTSFPINSLGPGKLMPDSVGSRRRRSRSMERAARAIVERMLSLADYGELILVDAGCDSSGEQAVARYGSSQAKGDGPMAVAEIHDPRVWSALLKEGSIGLGRGYVEGWWSSPDPGAVVRFIINNIGPVDEVRNQLGRFVHPLSDRFRRTVPGPGRTRNREDIASHYDIGNDFFELFLDETLTYSSAVFDNPAQDLAQASIYKYDMLIDSLGLTSDHHLLEIGTGWGGMAIRAAQRTGCRVTTTTISQAQLDRARQRVGDAGLDDQVDVISRDWRDLDGCFDRVVSVEMIEAVDWRHYRQFFATIERCLADDGVATLQAICVPDRRYHRTKNTEDYIRRFVFPGGFLPSIGAIVDAVAAATRLQVVGVNDFTAHYAETLRRWNERFDARIDDVGRLGLDQRFVRLWRFYLAYCQAGFLERHCTVNHFRLVGPRWRGSLANTPATLR
jgi:cyclopropane-fatty-acyl-phospholipid synthase